MRTPLHFGSSRVNLQLFDFPEKTFMELFGLEIPNCRSAQDIAILMDVMTLCPLSQDITNWTEFVMHILGMSLQC